MEYLHASVGHIVERTAESAERAGQIADQRSAFKSGDRKFKAGGKEKQEEGHDGPKAPVVKAAGDLPHIAAGLIIEHPCEDRDAADKDGKDQEQEQHSLAGYTGKGISPGEVDDKHAGQDAQEAGQTVCMEGHLLRTEPSEVVDHRRHD